MVDGARAGNAGLVALVEEVEAAAMLAPHFPARFAVWLELERPLEKPAALLRGVGVGANAVEALQRELLRHLGMVGNQRLVRALAGDQRVAQALGIAEGKPAVGV